MSAIRLDQASNLKARRARLLLMMTLKGKTMFASLHTATLATRRVQSAGSAPRLWTLVRSALAAQRQRQFLARLDDRTLADIGLTRDQAVSEAQRPMWDIPANWNGRILA